MKIILAAPLFLGYLFPLRPKRGAECPPKILGLRNTSAACHKKSNAGSQRSAPRVQPSAAQHLFSTYYPRGSTQYITLHFEYFSCQNRTAICTKAGCPASNLCLDRRAVSNFVELSHYRVDVTKLRT